MKKCAYCNKENEEAERLTKVLDGKFEVYVRGVCGECAKENSGKVEK